MKSKTVKSETGRQYVYDYSSAITKAHASRTAEKQAGWFLPYLQPGMSVLDCGCGSGSITVGLAKAVSPGRVSGVDISESEIRQAGQRAVDNAITNVHFDVGDLYHLDFPDNFFDALFSHNVLEHLTDPSKALEEMRRVLKPSGIIGIRDVDFGGFLLAPDTGFWERNITIWETEYKRTGGGDPNIGRHLGRLLHEAGFVEVKMSASYDTFSDLESRRFILQTTGSRLTEKEFVERVTQYGLAKAEELRALKKAWESWAEVPGAIFAVSHCEVIGRKP